MKRFLFNILIFACCFLCFVGTCELLVRQIPNDYSVKKNLLEKKHSNIKILCLGNSQMYFGINPVFFNKTAFNAAHVSEPLQMSQFILNKFDSGLDSLETIIISMSIFTPFSTWEPGGKGEAWRIKHYHIYYDYPIPWYDIEDRFELSNLNYNNLIRWKKALLNPNGIVYSDEMGFGHNYLQYHTRDWENCSDAIRVHTTDNYSKSPNVEYNRQILQQIIEKHPHANIILLTTPCWKTYTENVDQGQRHYVEKISSEIADQYENCIYMNLFEDSRFTAEDFADAYHLSEAGACKLTKIMNAFLNDIQ